MLGTPAAPVLQTPRLILRGWRPEDFSPYAAMLADPETARFITRTGLPYGEREAWAETAFLIGHWQLLGYGMFVVEERATGAFIGRVGPLEPKGWFGLEIAWALVPAARGKGYAVEAARATIDWTFGSFSPPRIVSVIHPHNKASQRVAERVGERRSSEQFARSASLAISGRCAGRTGDRSPGDDRRLPIALIVRDHDKRSPGSLRGPASPSSPMTLNRAGQTRRAPESDRRRLIAPRRANRPLRHVSRVGPR
jgi:RimJ/RimL family protein N-acetyltransferase